MQTYNKGGNSLSSIFIKGTGVYLPELVISNDDFSKIVETSDEWITTRTGIRQRYLSKGEPTWSMSAKSGMSAIKNSGLSPNEIDLIIHTSVTPDYYTPSMSCVVQGKIGAINSICIDINVACAGFVYALDMAKHYLLNPDIKNILIISTENLSKIVDYTDRSTCVLFGDASASCVVNKSDSFYGGCFKTEGEGAKHIFARLHPSGNVFSEGVNPRDADDFGVGNDNIMYMDGKEVYKFAIRVIPIAIKEACEKSGVLLSDLDYIICHQANIRIIETASSNLGISMDKFYINLDKYGNTSSASIPLCIDELNKSGTLKKGDNICIVGFGAGLTYGAVVFEWK